MEQKHGSAHAGDSTRGRTADGQAMVGEPDRMFMTKAAQGGMAEVQLAQLAQEKAASDSVKQVAKKIQEDHTNANNELKQIAQQKGVDLPTDVGPKHQALIQKLQGLSGEQFDRAYLKAMVDDHKKDIKEFQRQTDRGMDSDVKGFASKTLPHLQEHLQQVQQAMSGQGSSRARSTDSSNAATPSSR